MADGPSKTVIETARDVLRYLRTRPEGATKNDLATRARDSPISSVTVQRALQWLRDQDAPVLFDRATMAWRLTDPTFSLPLIDPGREDLEAVLLATALLQPHVDSKLADRLTRLVEEMDQRVRDRDGATAALRPGVLTATVTRGAPVDPHLLDVLSRAVGRQVVTLSYTSPWSQGPSATRMHEVEPWQLRIHDSTYYLRGWSRTRGAPVTFRLAQIAHARVLPDVHPAAKMPGPERIWGDHDPAFGIDEDRPDVAVIRLRGAVARWAAMDRWHPAQEDRWIEPGELVERRVPYRSVREFARRLMTVAAGLQSVEPAPLRAQVIELAANAAALEQH